MRCRIARTEAVEGAGIGDRLFKTTKPCYQLDITKAEEKAGPRWVDYDGTRYAISYVDKVEAVPYRGDVVNLSVEGNPTFQTSVGMSHNTVKPVKLMEWLVSLVCPKDGVVVDPYCGSGTTCLAAVNKGIRFVGIEKDPEFFNIALKRLEPVKSAQEDKEFFKDTFDFMASLDME
jgi:predicted methyltransferase